MGATTAIDASRIALQESGKHKVSLDQVIRARYETGEDLQTRDRETLLEGLATLNIIEY